MPENEPPSFFMFEYGYRDAGNFKAFGGIIVRGLLKEGERQQLIDELESEKFFVAEQVGIPPLYGALYELSDGATINDHSWHEFVGFSDCKLVGDECSIWGDAVTLLNRFRSVAYWDQSLSPHFGVKSKVNRRGAERFTDPPAF